MMSDKSQKSNTFQLTDNQLTWPHMLFQWLCIHSILIYIRLTGEFNIRGKENRPKEWQPMIIASNHTSTLDPPVMSLSLDYTPIAYMAKIELFQQPFWRIYNWAMSSIPVNREKLELSTVKTVLKVLKHGKWAVGIFPEGTRTQDGAVDNPKKGVAYFAKAAKVPILPLGIVHLKENGRRKTNVRIGQLIPPEDDLDALGKKIQESIQALVEQAKRDP